jgi:hypothetical protein
MISLFWVLCLTLPPIKHKKENTHLAPPYAIHHPQATHQSSLTLPSRLLRPVGAERQYLSAANCLRFMCNSHSIHEPRGLDSEHRSLLT